MTFLYRTEKNKALYRRHRAQRWLVSTLLALLALLFIFCVWLRPLRMGNASMSPCFEDGALIVANRLSKFFRMPARTDIVWFTEDGSERVRRIVGMPGETVSGRDGHLCVNGDYLLEEPYTESATADFEAFTVPQGQVLCLPDNRDFFTGTDAAGYCLAFGDIKGLVHIKLLPEPAYCS